MNVVWCSWTLQCCCSVGYFSPQWRGDPVSLIAALEPSEPINILESVLEWKYLVTFQPDRNIEAETETSDEDVDNKNSLIRIWIIVNDLFLIYSDYLWAGRLSGPVGDPSSMKQMSRDQNSWTDRLDWLIESLQLKNFVVENKKYDYKLRIILSWRTWNMLENFKYKYF